ncbi:MAG: Fe-S cluster assembly protein SufB, partial [Candidatus Micrarchaeia archaeon]
MQDPTIDEEEYAKKYGFKSNVEYIYKPEKGLSERIIRAISNEKHEPEWMLEKRLEAYKIYREKPMPRWGIDLSRIDFEDFYYYLKPTEKKANSWEEVPEEIKDAFEKLGVPEAERKFFAGTEAQFDSEVIYGNVKKTLSEQGVIFT